MVQKQKSTTERKVSEPALIPVSEPSNATQDERLYKEILDAIFDRRLSPGIKLEQDELADIFFVSRRCYCRTESHG